MERNLEVNIYEDKGNSFGYLKIEDIQEKLANVKLYETFQSKLLEEDYTKDTKLTKDNNFRIGFLRERLYFYRGMDTESHNIEPSIMRLYGTSKRYNIVSESKYCNSMFSLDFMKDGIDNDISLKLLARMQHYGYNSRLVDITFNEFVAMYMASYTKFTTVGKVIEFAYKGNTSLKEYTNTLSRYHYTFNLSSDIAYNLNIINKIAGLNKKVEVIPKSYKSEPVVVIDRSTFKGFTETYDMRYNSQDGAFICVLNDFDNQKKYKLGSLDNKYLTTKKLKYRRVHNYDKFTILFLLAKSEITHTTIYPDSDIANAVNKITSKISIISDKTDKFNSCISSLLDYENINNIYKTLNKADKSNISSLINQYIFNKGLIQFFLTDYVNIIAKRNDLISKKDSYEISEFNKAVDRLLHYSKEHIFKYLKI